MIDDALFQFLCSWYDLERDRSQYLPRKPGYAALLREQDRAAWALDASLDSGGQAAFLEYEAARNALSNLAEEAAFLTGIRAGLRLCLRL